MTKKIVSWVLVGAFTYLWWWLGYQWEYLNREGAEWTDIYVLYTLLTLIVIYRKPSQS